MTQCVKKEEHPDYVTVMHGFRGYFAVIMCWSDKLNGYLPTDGGIARHADPKAAAAEAKDWASVEGLKFRPNAR
jgi:hypothetical protein